MDRLKEYCSFAVWFAGIGYLPLWPLSANGPGGGLFGASLICGAPSWLDLLCRPPYPLTLSPALHLLGIVSACYVGLCLLHRGLRRLRRRPAAAATPLSLPDAAPVASHRQKPSLPSRPVKPRAHFGLRSIKRAADLRDMA